MPIVAVAEVPVDRNSGFRHCNDLVRLEVADRVGESRVTCTYSVTLTQAAAGEQGKSRESAGINMSNETEIMAIDVGCVLAFIGKSDFELSWKVGFPVKRIVFFLHTGRGLPVEPDLKIRTCARLQLTRKLLRVAAEILSRSRRDRRRAAHYVPGDVAACGKSCQIDAVQPRNQFLK